MATTRSIEVPKAEPGHFQHEGSLSPAERLAWAVIAQAVEDIDTAAAQQEQGRLMATGKTSHYAKDAIVFLFSSSLRVAEHRAWWFHIAGLDESTVHNSILTRHPWVARVVL